VEHEDAHCGVSDDWIGDIGQHPPDIAHPSTKLFRFGTGGDEVAFMSIQSSNKSPYAGTFN
jgi:hypothetical protein